MATHKEIAARVAARYMRAQDQQQQDQDQDQQAQDQQQQDQDQDQDQQAQDQQQQDQDQDQQALQQQQALPKSGPGKANLQRSLDMLHKAIDEEDDTLFDKAIHALQQAKGTRGTRGFKI